MITILLSSFSVVLVLVLDLKFWDVSACIFGSQSKQYRLFKIFQAKISSRLPTNMQIIEFVYSNNETTPKNIDEIKDIEAIMDIKMTFLPHSEVIQ
jgi:hypothetical protein